MAAVKTALDKIEIKRIEEAELLRDEPKDRFQFDVEKHMYTLDGKPMHGITTILRVIAKPALITWAANMAVDHIWNNTERFLGELNQYNEANFLELCEEARNAHTKKKESAGEAGTTVHAEIEAYINYCLQHEGWAVPLLNELDKEVAPQTNEFVSWALKYGVKFFASELKLYSEKLWCAGTADFICEINGKMYVGDVKTSSAIYPEFFIQASAYAHMAREMKLYDKFHGVIIVNVPKRGGLVVKENYDLKGNFEAFKAALVLHKFQQAQVIKKKK